MDSTGGRTLAGLRVHNKVVHVRSNAAQIKNPGGSNSGAVGVV